MNSQESKCGSPAFRGEYEGLLRQIEAFRTKLGIKPKDESKDENPDAPVGGGDKSYSFIPKGICEESGFVMRIDSQLMTFLTEANKYRGKGILLPGVVSTLIQESVGKLLGGYKLPEVFKVSEVREHYILYGMLQEKENLFLINCENNIDVIVDICSGTATLYHEKFLIDDEGNFRYPNMTMWDIVGFFCTLSYWWTGQDNETENYYVSDAQVKKIKEKIIEHLPQNYECNSFTLRPYKFVDGNPTMIFTSDNKEYYLSVKKNGNDITMSLDYYKTLVVSN